MKKLLFICLVVFQGCLVSKPKVENASYATAIFSHANFLSSCVSCHESKRPVALAGVAHGGGADCAGCHQPPTWAFSHNTGLASCVACHETKRPASTTHLNALGATATVTSHFSTQDCASCHTYTSGTFPAAWAFKHNPIPVACVTCHDVVGSSRRPSGHSSGTKLTSDCKSCHLTSTWANGASHDPVPSSCVGCHESARPATTSPILHTSTSRLTKHFYKVKNGVTTAVDCVKCHVPGSWSSAIANWDCKSCHSGHHSPTNCKTCHSPVAGSWD